jgi:hypothetical protein
VCSRAATQDAYKDVIFSALEASSTRGDAALVTRGFTIAKSAENLRIFFSVVSTMASVKEEVPTHVDSLANAKRTADWLTAMTKHQEERLEEDCPASTHIFKQFVVLQVAISKFAAANARALASCAEAVDVIENVVYKTKF